MCGFAIITVYMTVAAFFLAFRGISDVEKQNAEGKSLFGNRIFRNIVLSLVATLGLYIISSILFVSIRFLHISILVGSALIIIFLV